MQSSNALALDACWERDDRFDEFDRNRIDDVVKQPMPPFERPMVPFSVVVTEEKRNVRPPMPPKADGELKLRVAYKSTMSRLLSYAALVVVSLYWFVFELGAQNYGLIIPAGIASLCAIVLFSLRLMIHIRQHQYLTQSLAEPDLQVGSHRTSRPHRA